MSRAVLAASLAACAVAPGCALADCNGAGSATAGPVYYYTADEPVLAGLNASLVLGLEPSSFPAANILKAPQRCKRGAFTAMTDTWTLYGDDEGEPPRWATNTADASQVVFLAPMPSADEAGRWSEAQRRSPANASTAHFKTRMFALVLADGARRKVYGFYDAIPTDERLKQDMQAVLEGRTPYTIDYDTVAHRADFARTGAPYTLAFLASRGSLAMSGRPSPDGEAFKSLAGDVAEAPLSGLRCPPLDGYRRVDLVSTGTDKGAIEAGCRYAADGVRLSIFATYVSAKDSGQVFQILAATAAANSVGQPLATPIVTPRADTPMRSIFFNAAGGGEYGLWTFQQRDWAFEIFALYGRGHESAVGAAATVLIDSNESGPPPGGGVPDAPPSR